MYALLLLQNLDYCSAFSTSSVILVTDNVTKAAPGWYSDGTNKAYWDGNVVSQFQACSVLSIVLNFHRRLLVLYYFRTCSSFNHCTD
jgi:hypothetical protein